MKDLNFVQIRTVSFRGAKMKLIKNNDTSIKYHLQFRKVDWAFEKFLEFKLIQIQNSR